MKLSAADQQKLLAALQRTSQAIEEVVAGGLTAASEATHQTLGVTFKEASRLRLLRLGSTLRNAHDEIARFVNDDQRFSQSRLVFFLNRCWIMCRGIQRAIELGETATLANLLMTPSTTQCEAVQVVCLGVVKKIAPGAFCAFEFRLRDVDSGSPLVWSTVFPMKAGVEIPAEGFLHLPQKQKFPASVFLEKCELTISNCSLTESTSGPPRIQLLEESTVSTGKPFDQWERFLSWSPKEALQRIDSHEVSPFDVDMELHEEVSLGQFEFIDSDDEDETPSESDQHRIPIVYREMMAELVVSRSAEGESLLHGLQEMKKRKKAKPGVLFGVMYYSEGRILVQPLTLFEKNEPHYLTIATESIDRKALLQALKFT